MEKVTLQGFDSFLGSLIRLWSVLASNLVVIPILARNPLIPK
jgi:hypothetical protein